MSVSKINRALGSIIGTFVSDAAAIPLEWIYNYETFDKVTAGKESYVFFPESHCPFFKLPIGTNSCYADEGLALLKSLNEAKDFDDDSYKKALEIEFGENSKYKYGTERTRPFPVDFAWANSSILYFLKMYLAGDSKTGADDSQGDAFSKIAPIVVLYAGKPELKQVIEKITRITQANDMAVDYAVAAALILENYILNGPSEDWEPIFAHLTDEVVENIKKVLSMKDMDHRQAVGDVGMACNLPGSFLGALHGIISRGDKGFANLVQSNIHAAGDCCSRGCFVGACAGAIYGIDAIPEDWFNKTLVASDALAMAKNIINLNSNIVN